MAKAEHQLTNGALFEAVRAIIGDPHNGIEAEGLCRLPNVVEA